MSNHAVLHRFSFVPEVFYRKLSLRSNYRRVGYLSNIVNLLNRSILPIHCKLLISHFYNFPFYQIICDFQDKKSFLLNRIDNFLNSPLFDYFLMQKGNLKNN